MKTKIFAKIMLGLAVSGLLFWLPAGAAFAVTKGATTITDQEIENNLRSNPILKDIQTVVDVLSAGVAIVVVAMIIVGGIQYSLAGDNSSAVTAAKKRIANALIALFAFIFMFSFIEWLVPGGIFG
jgi:hypothetical protein